MNKFSLLSMHDLSVGEINAILNDALLFDRSYQDWQLPVKKALVANLFLRLAREPITPLRVQNCS